MHTVMWTFKVPAGTSKAQLIETINATAHTYEGIPGLIRKYYGITPDGGSIVGIYLWETSRRRRVLHARMGGDGDQALGGPPGAPGLGNTDGRGERRAAINCRRIVAGRDRQKTQPEHAHHEPRCVRKMYFSPIAHIERCRRNYAYFFRVRTSSPLSVDLSFRYA